MRANEPNLSIAISLIVFLIVKGANKILAMTKRYAAMVIDGIDSWANQIKNVAVETDKIAIIKSTISFFISFFSFLVIRSR